MAVVITDSEGKQVIDLKASYGKRWKVTKEADGATWEQWTIADRAWLYEIVGHNGMVHPYGGELLCAVSNTGHIGARLRRLPFVLAVRGDDETVIRFHVDHVEDVFKIIRPRRRRQVSEAERERLRGFSIQHGFQKGQKHGVQRAATALESTQPPGDVG